MPNTFWRCLNRANAGARLVSQRNATSLAPGLYRCFNTNTPLQRTQPAVVPQRAKKQRQAAKRKKREKGRPPDVGERRELRKRVVLSNTNALDVNSLPSWDSENLGDKSLQGKVVSLQGETIDRLRASGAFQPRQGWSFFKRPSFVIRPATTQLHDALEEVQRGREGGQHMKTARALIAGERGSGKSVALLQAMAMAFLNDWVVIHIPEAQDLVLGHTHYAPLATPSPSNPNTLNPSLPLYVQKDYTAKLLASIAKANSKVLSQLQLTLNHSDLPIPVEANISLDSLAKLGAEDADIAWPIFTALWQELTSTEPASDGSRRPPVLLALDGLAHVCRPSQYVAPSMHFIHAHDLALVDHFMRYFSGRDALPNGGVVLAADSASNRPSNAAVDLAIRQSREHKIPLVDAKPLELPVHDPQNPWTPIDTRSVRALRAAGVISMDGLSKDEARAVLEYYAQSGVWRRPVNEKTISDVWTLAGHGVIGEMERVTVRAGHA